MSHFLLEKTPIDGLKVIHRQRIRDERGYLERMFCAEELKLIIGQSSIVQINHTLTKKAGTVRGMHFQYPPHAEMKFVSCLRGEVFDVAVDLRKGSPTFLHWYGKILSDENQRTFCLHEGFAHGFQTLTEDCELIYLHTAAYAPDAEAGLDALDPRLAIGWPLPVLERSERDQQHAMLTPEFSGLSL
jgi:dTDP-4-dehydrorhamnose 3,5-epimerase